MFSDFYKNIDPENTTNEPNLTSDFDERLLPIVNLANYSWSFFASFANLEFE